MTKVLTILGSTGSIGTNALQVIEANKNDLKVGYLTAGSNAPQLIQQALKFRPKAVAIADESKYLMVKEALSGEKIEVMAGREGILNISSRTDVDLVLNAIVGTPGLEPTYNALRAGKTIALSNKESLVMAGEVIMDLAAARGLPILPVDSEHSAIFQCLIGEKKTAVSKLLLTGSGGPFRKQESGTFADITPEDALKHPTWVMGRKITIDSATMMNKGLEVIEAKWLFDMDPENIDIVVHPQSIIHSMVEFCDGSIKAQLGLPDMKLPIQYALFYPERKKVKWENTNFFQIAQLTFEAPDFSRFPCLRLAYDSLKRGGTAPAVLNVVNEEAVYAFLDRKIKFTDIPGLVEKALGAIPVTDHPDIHQILEIERISKEFLKREIG
ncbi:MAG: 1-deoxy-D-xylulose-5-phosphate reductoisomerase [Candidatus Marinimicrobia bacterium]|nr:1-deoxy-D-xylulose-5-phosphate reductoisomerase [Candidatus Neomarinimicrobiota bacterium]